MPGPGGHTLLYLQTQKAVRDFGEKMDGLLFRWQSLSYGGPLLIELPSGKAISYAGIAFQGSPRVVFWGSWSEDFFEEEIPKIIATTGQMAVDAQIDIGLAIEEAAEELRALVQAFYDKFSHADQVLMGNGSVLGKW